MHELHGTVSHDDGLTLTVTRDLSIPVEELWSWITESDRTAQWYGPWSGDGRVGATVQVTMTSDEGSPTMGMRITECSPPHRLGLASEAPPPFAWPLALQCATREGGSSITLHHTQIPAEMSLGDIGPGGSSISTTSSAPSRGARHRRSRTTCRTSPSPTPPSPDPHGPGPPAPTRGEGRRRGIRLISRPPR